MTTLGIENEKAVFYIGSFINPKEMINSMTESLSSADLETKKQQILDIHNYLYKFSIERLRSFINQPELLLLVVHYITSTEMKRVHTKENMIKYQEAYYEAFEAIINNCSDNEKLKPYLS